MNSRLLTLCDDAEIETSSTSIGNFTELELLGSPIDMGITTVQRLRGVPTLKWGGGHPIPITIRVRSAPTGLVSGGTYTFAIVTSPTLKASGDVNFVACAGSGMSRICIYSGYIVATGTWGNFEYATVGREFSFYMPTQVTTARYIQLGALGSHAPSAAWKISAWIGGPDTRNWTPFTEGFR